MAQETKNAIRRAFIRLLNERPIDKISIKDIAETGAVNRNTFYYYYADIYALVEDIFEMEAADFLTKMRRYESWQEAFLDATDFAMQNKRAVFHLYNSANQGTLRRYYHKVILGAMMTYVQGQGRGSDSTGGGHPGAGGILLRRAGGPDCSVASGRDEI